MLVRVTPQSALPVVQQLSLDLSHWLEEAGNIGPATRFREGLDALDHALVDRFLGIDFPCHTELAALVAQEFFSGPSATLKNEQTHIGFNGRRGGFLLREVDLAFSPTERVGSLFHPIFLFESADASLEDREDDRELFLADRPVAICVTSTKSGPSTAMAGPWVMECTEKEKGLKSTLIGHLATSAGEPLFDVLLAYSIVSSLDSLSGGLELAIDQELRGLKAKKAIVAQRVSRSQQRTGLGSTTEIMSELRQRLQRHTTDFERGVSDRMMAFFTPQVGSLSRKLEELLLEIHTLSRVKRSRTEALELAPQTEDSLMAGLRSEVGRHFTSDVGALRDMFRILQVEVEEFVAARGGPPVIPQIEFLTEERMQRLIDNCMNLQRHYAGDVMTHGLFEYAMAARRYLTLLFMALSAFGLLSYFRRSMLVMLPISFLILVIGGLLAANNMRRERADTTEKELEKARELMRNECKRIFSDLQRGWVLCSPNIWQSRCSNCSTRSSPAHETIKRARQPTLPMRKQRIQRHLQVLETTEKRLQTAAKGRETVGKAISQTRGELKQLFLNLGEAATESGPDEGGHRPWNHLLPGRENGA